MNLKFLFSKDKSPKHPKNQDAFLVSSNSDTTALIIADGHGGAPYVRSSMGSRIACLAAKKAVDSHLTGDELKATIKDGFDKLGAAVPEEDDFRTEEGLTKIRNDAARLQKDIVMSGYNSSVYKSKEAVSKTIERYMKVFAGADNVNAIKVENVSDVQVSESIKSIKDIPAMLDAFDIKPISDQEKTKLNEYFKSQALKNKDKNNEVECVVRMCFYVKYRLNIEQ